MEKQKTLVVKGLGILLIALALFADIIGLGTNQGFGYKQIIALIAGAGLLFASCKACKSDTPAK